MLQENRPPPRRPVWKPSPTRQLLAFLWTARTVIFKSGAIVAFALLVLYTWAGVFHDVLVIDPFSVPKRFAEAGLTPEVVADRIRDALRQIEAEADAELQDRIALRDDEAESMPDIEIPRTGFGLRKAVEVAREVFGIHPRHVSGEIAQPLSSPQHGETRISMVIRVTQGRNRGQPTKFETLESDNADLLVRTAAEMILTRVNPILLAVYWVPGDAAKAAAIAQQTIEESSQNFHLKAQAHNVLGLALGAQGKYDEAILNFRVAVKDDPRWAAPYNNWGYALHFAGRRDEAIAKYRQAIALDPKTKCAYDNWAAALAADKRYDEAIAKLREAVAVDPKYARAYSNWCATLYATGNTMKP